MTAELAATTPARGLLVIERILRDRDGLWTQIVQERNLKSLIGELTASSAVALALYGVVLGASNGFMQALASAVKLPILFLVTLLICLPTLYLFNLVFGARLSIRQALALVLVAVTVISALSLAFAPVSLFFLVTAPNYAFYKILNVVILMLTGAVGLGLLLDGMRSLNKLATAKPTDTADEQPAALAVPAQAPAQPVPGQPFPGWGPHHPQQPQFGMVRPPEPRVNMTLIRIWVLLFGFVATQLAWTLRPFLGSPDEKFQIFRAVEGNFYVNIAQTIADLF